MKIVNAILLKVNEKPQKIQVNSTLENWQKLVGGYIDVVSLENGVDLIINDNGKINNLPYNKILHYIKGDKIYIDLIAGDAIVVGVNINEGEFISLNEEQIKKYLNTKNKIDIYL